MPKEPKLRKLRYQNAPEGGENFKKWLRASNKGSEFYHCCVCDIDGQAYFSDVKRHGDSQNHIKNCVGMAKQPKIKFADISHQNQIKRAELLVAAFIAENNLPYDLAPDLCCLIKKLNIDFGSYLNEISVGRTKAAALIKNVLGEDMENKVIEKKCRQFSILLDESTDKSSIKGLAAVVRFANDNLQPVDRFLFLKNVEKCTSEGLMEIVTQFFDDNNIPFSNGIGYASDNANVMCGGNHSLMTLLKERNPKTLDIRCTSHSLHLCAQKASKALPKHLEELMHMMHNYFSHSPKRASEFKGFQELWGDNQLKLLHPMQRL